jgi:hypothetical protein
VYTDIVGPFPVATPAGYRYFIGFTDKSSTYTWAILLRNKSEAPAAVKQFYMETIASGQFLEGTTITYLSSDRGGEFFNSELKEFLASKGIRHQSGPPYTPELNSIQERMNRTLVEMVVALLIQASLALYCWGLALDAAIYIRNRCPTASNEYFITPYEKLFGQVPHLSHMRVFGSRCFYHVPKQLRHKLQPKSKEGIFAGVRCFE